MLSLSKGSTRKGSKLLRSNYHNCKGSFRNGQSSTRRLNTGNGECQIQCSQKYFFEGCFCICLTLKAKPSVSFNTIKTGISQSLFIGSPVKRLDTYITVDSATWQHVHLTPANKISNTAGLKILLEDMQLDLADHYENIVKWEHDTERLSNKWRENDCSLVYGVMS